MFIFNVIQLVIIILLALAAFYIFIFSIAGLFYRQRPNTVISRHRKIAVLVPGYKEDEVIVDVAKEALNQDYPAGLFEVVIIADSFKPATLDKLRALPVTLIEVSFDKSTKAKALNKAMEKLQSDFDIAVVLDADNIMAEGFLSKINAAFEKDHMAVQGHRSAKNMNTPLAVLDAISEEINNHIFRKGHRVLGFSSAIIGSGMAFRYDFFKEMMPGVKAVGGFDKEIELKMLKAGHKIEYLDDAIVFDEKVHKEEVFSNQRRRWLSAQFHYFRKDFLSSVKHLVKEGNVDYFDKAVQFIQPPRILLLGILLIPGTVFIMFNLLLHNIPFAITWAALIVLCLSSFAFSIPSSFYNRKTLRAILSLPKGMLLMFGSLLRIRGANKEFIHTRHSAIKAEPQRK
jgi:cellulose synthase/poly-beta-1,6-N-acetylglucosamine synthase-like glycosyltransferase